ncbi:MAG: PilZ domain-containing protein [Bacteriovorax sp.]|nr:PilZ domain-containing protein [Bacteriovorax sp.]
MKEQKTGKDFDRMIVEAVQGNFSFYAWHSFGGVVEKCELKVKAYRKDYGEIELDVKPEHHESLAKVISGNRVLNIYVPELSVSFTAELKSVNTEKKVKIYVPKEYSFYERRKHERLQPLKTCYMSFEVNKLVFKKSIFDISLGGIAIILPKTDKMIIAQGKEFPVLVLDVYGRKMKVKAECINSVNIDRFKLDSLPYGGYKIAFRFTAISKEDKDYLVEFVTHQILLQQIKKAN